MTLASVVMKEPDFTAAPQRVRRVLERCLEKDPKKRLRDISGVELLLDGTFGAGGRRPDLRLPWMAWIGMGLAGAAAIVLGFSLISTARPKLVHWYG